MRQLEEVGQRELDWVKRPLKKIEFTVGRRGDGGRGEHERLKGHPQGGYKGRAQMSVRGGYKGGPDSGSGEKEDGDGQRL